MIVWSLAPTGSGSWPLVTPAHGICRPLLACKDTCTHTHRPIWTYTHRDIIKNKVNLEVKERGKVTIRSRGDDNRMPSKDNEMPHACNSSTWREGKARRSGAQDQPQLHTKLEAQPGYVILCINTHPQHRRGVQREQYPER